MKTRNRGTTLLRRPTVRQVALTIVSMVLLAFVALAGLELLAPGTSRALLVRAVYSRDERLVSIENYRDLVPISATARHGQASGQASLRDEPSRADQNELISRFAELTSSNIVIMDAAGAVLAESYHARSGAQPEMFTNSMSMAKTLIGLLVGVAIDKGDIGSVEESIGAYLPEFAGDSRGALTFKHLLQMRSGLEGQNTGFPLSHLQLMYYGDSPDAEALAVRAIRPPGEIFEYNSINSQILLVVLERAMGAEFERLLSTHIWRPLGLDTAYSWRGSSTGDAKGFCCVFATARTWAAIGRVFLDASRSEAVHPTIVSRSWLQEMTKPAHDEERYGYHIWVGNTQREHMPFVSLEGTPQQFVFVFPTLGIVAVRVGDEDARFSVEDFLAVVMTTTPAFE